MSSRRVILDPKQIRVLAHPLRSRLLGRLRLDGPLTATRLAEVLGTNTGATSYHLRQLADVGLVVEDSDTGRGRERWWRAAHDISSWKRDAFEGDPDATAASDWLEGQQLAYLNERVERWRQVQNEEPAEWRAAASFSDYYVTVNAEQLSAMTAELDAVIERYRQAAPGPDARQVMYYLCAMPRIEEP
ncbi:winged helix-turn-helix domain-containing protein [Actinoplanes sp. TFC3]|uniref:winged helix-turn-helix domain-containing protein n=1 Tax=Actinoplanes sp. TFC3 TaxID=1710355 RepID=UPI000835E02D|nr:winged helix-turn-helix domain-containing protein [Actinoplanes sp. TFC3]